MNGTTRPCTYLRTVVTTRCPMSCSYCHYEGDQQRPGTRNQLAPEALSACLAIAATRGIRKFKFLGGEPLVYRDLPRVVADLRAVARSADLSVISAGVTLRGLLQDCLGAGLDRVNVSIHGYGYDAFARRGGSVVMWHQRNAFLEEVIDAGRPLKLNFVLADQAEIADLGELLAWAAGRPVTVNVLDDLRADDASAQGVIEVLRALRGPEALQVREPDPDSLETAHLHWRDGLRVEVKDERLGDLAPWRACTGCPARARCREGIFALRLTHDGRLQACMDRPDLSLDLVGVLQRDGREAATKAWDAFVAGL